jgi:hypothetical protein
VLPKENKGFGVLALAFSGDGVAAWVAAPKLKSDFAGDADCAVVLALPKRPVKGLAGSVVATAPLEVSIASVPGCEGGTAFPAADDDADFGSPCFDALKLGNEVVEADFSEV